MGDKYIIELEDKPFHNEDGDFLYRAKGFNSLVFDMTGISKLTLYIEPDLEQAKDEAYNEGYKAGREAEKVRQIDLEQVRREAYEHGYENGFVDGHLKAEKSGQSFYEVGYKCGLADAWDAARKIGSNSLCSLKEMGFDFSQCDIADYNPSWFVIKNYSASEAIEKIRQYEQEQEESKKEQSVTVEEVMRQYLNTFCKSSRCVECILHTSDFTCGRGYHFLSDSPVSDEEVRRAYAKVVKEQ